MALYMFSICSTFSTFYTDFSSPFFSLAESPVLEIERANLSALVLQLKSLGLDDVLNVDFIDPPSKESLLMSLKQSFLLGALDGNGSLTELGRRVVSLPLEPLYAR